MDLDEQAKCLLDVIIECGLEEQVSVTRLHYHYLLSKGEKVVIYRKNETKMTKRPLKDGLSFPIGFLFDASGQLHATEFMSCEVDPKKREVIKERVVAVLKNSTFMEKLRNVILSNDFHTLLGFQINYADVFLVKKDGDELHEDNWDRYQEMTYRPLSSDSNQKAVTTTWRVRTDGVRTDGDDRAMVCLARMYCQWTGQSHMRLSDGHDEY